MANAGLSDGFVFAPKPPAAPAANIRVSVPPYNKDVFKSGNETIMINIPSGKRGQYLNTRMSYMTFDVTVEMDATNASETTPFPILALDGGAHSFFNSLEVYHGSNLLEQIREYNTLYQILHDSGELPDCSVNGRTVAEGSEANGVTGMNQNDTVRGGRLITPCVFSKKDSGFVVGYDYYLSMTSESNEEVYTRDYLHQYSTQLVPNYDDLYLAGAGLANSFMTNSALKSGGGTIELESATYEQNATITGLSILSITSEMGSAVLLEKGKMTYTFAIPLVSGIVGAQMGKYIPVGSLAADLRLELGLAPFEQVFKTIGVLEGSTIFCDTANIHASTSGKSFIGSSVSASTPYKINIENVELQLEYVEVSSDVQMAIESSTGGQYVMSFDSYHDFQNTMSANPGSITQLIGAKFSSIKTIYTAFRDQYQINNIAYPGITSRVNPFSTLPNRPEYKNPSINTWAKRKYESGTGWQYMIGSTLYPPKPVASDEEAFMEFVKSNHTVANQNRQGLSDLTHWGISARRDVGSDATAGVPSKWNQYCLSGGSYLMAQNFESQSHKSHLTESGINTLAQTMYMVARFPGPKKLGEKSFVNASTGIAYAKNLTSPASTDEWWWQGNQALQVDHFIHYDGILIISNGVCSTRF